MTAETDYRAKTLKSQLKSADRLGANISIILGDDEEKKDQVIIRNMQTKKQIELSTALVPKKLHSWLHNNVDIF